MIKIQYGEPEDLRDRLRAQLIELRPLMVQRKLAFGDYDMNIVGDRIRRLREAQGLTRAEVAAATGVRFPISVDALQHLEKSSDRDANPTLIVLRELATTLKTTVADLVEPDLDEYLLNSLSTWVSERRAARSAGMSARDRNKVLRRILLRLIDNLERDD